MVKFSETTSGRLIWGIVALVAAIVIIWFGIWLAEIVPKVGVAASTTYVELPAWLSSWIVEGGSVVTLESLVIFLAIFVILLFAIADTLELFSTFTPATCWVIAFGLAAIASVTKVVALIAGLLGIAAGIGALGIVIIILSSIFAAVTLNLGIGGAARRWRLARQVEVDSIKSAKGANRVSKAIEGLKSVEKAFKDGEIS